MRPSFGTAHVNLIVVCNSAGAMVGVVSKTDIVRHISHCHGQACAISVSGVMSRNVTSCAPSDFLHEVWSIMKTLIIQCVPVIGADSKAVGFSTRAMRFRLC